MAPAPASPLPARPSMDLGCCTHRSWVTACCDGAAGALGPLSSQTPLPASCLNPNRDFNTQSTPLSITQCPELTSWRCFQDKQHLLAVSREIQSKCAELSSCHPCPQAGRELRQVQAGQILHFVTSSFFFKVFAPCWTHGLEYPSLFWAGSFRTVCPFGACSS